MTGSTSRIIAFGVAFPLRKSSATWSRLMSLRFFWPALSETSSRKEATSCSISMIESSDWTPSAPMPAENFLS